MEGGLIAVGAEVFLALAGGWDVGAGERGDVRYSWGEDSRAAVGAGGGVGLDISNVSGEPTEAAWALEAGFFRSGARWCRLFWKGFPIDGDRLLRTGIGALWEVVRKVVCCVHYLRAFWSQRVFLITNITNDYFL